MSFVLFGTVSQCCDATSILDGIISCNVGVTGSFRGSSFPFLNSKLDLMVPEKQKVQLH